MSFLRPTENHPHPGPNAILHVNLQNKQRGHYVGTIDFYDKRYYAL